MKKKICFIILLLFAQTIASFGQVAMGYSTDGNTLALSTNPLNKIWGELRVNTKGYNQAGWSYNDKGITQLYIQTPVITSNKVTLYTGAGLGMNLLTEGSDKWLSINIPVGLKMNPFTSLPDFYITGEYNPMIITSDDIPVIHSVSLGFRYILRKSK